MLELILEVQKDCNGVVDTDNSVIQNYSLIQTTSRHVQTKGVPITEEAFSSSVTSLPPIM